MSNAGGLAALALRLGVDCGDEDLEWAFGLEATRPLLEWMCEHIDLELVVSDDEWSAFRELEERGGVLEGHQLREALRAKG